MKDCEMRGIVLQRFYDLHHKISSLSFPKDLEFEGIDEVVVINICKQLYEKGLIDGNFTTVLSGECVSAVLHITAEGVDVVEETRAPPMAINLTQNIDDHSIHAGGSANVQAVTGDTQGNASVSQGSKKGIVGKFFAWVVGLFVKAHTGA